MKIKYFYKLIDNDKINVLDIDPKEYFDPIDTNCFKINDIPRYILIEEYISYSVSQIDFIKVEIVDDRNFLRIEYNFWNNGEFSSLKHFELNYKENYQIKFFKIYKEFKMDKKNCVEILSYYNNEIDVLELRSHKILNNDDGSVIEEIKKSKIEKDEILGKTKLS